MSTKYYQQNKVKHNAYSEEYARTHKEEGAAYLKKYYAVNKDKVLARHRERREAKRRLVQEAKDKPCADCGIKYPPYVMDFDHVRGNKVQTIGHLKGSIHIIRREIEKCDVVCSNCHRIRTFTRRDIT